MIYFVFVVVVDVVVVIVIVTKLTIAIIERKIANKDKIYIYINN